MSSSRTEPNEPPPSYNDATHSAPSTGAPSSHPNTSTSTSSNTLQVPRPRNGIPPSDRRSMEDESRDLPPHWVRQYDHKTHHQFFVDTAASPPRSIWHHPYDDDVYLSSLSPSERQRVSELHHPLPEDEGGSSADEHAHEHAHPELPPRTAQQGGEGKESVGRKIKDKLTGSTHAQRVAERRARDQQEAETYRRHQHIRQQMSKAAETGVPQLLGRDKNGKEVYIEPPMGMGGGGFGGAGRYGNGGYGYNPYVQGPYSNPNARYVRPQQPYGRPYPGMGYGYGGGYGTPLLGLGGGLLLGSLLF